MGRFSTLWHWYIAILRLFHFTPSRLIVVYMHTFIPQSLRPALRNSLLNEPSHQLQSAARARNLRLRGPHIRRARTNNRPITSMSPKEFAACTTVGDLRDAQPVGYKGNHIGPKV